jgi:hypothetical protein
MKKIIGLILVSILCSCSATNNDIQVQSVARSQNLSELDLVETNGKKTKQGYDVLAVAKYCPRFLKAPKLPAMSTLLATFGDPIPCVQKRIDLGGLELVQIDLIDATCWRNNVCPPGVPKPTDLAAIEQRAKEVNDRLVLLNPHVEWWISPALEHDVKDYNLVTEMKKAAKRGCPSCQIINSPMSGVTPAGMKKELHGTKVRAFSVSGDGASMFDGDNMRSDCPKKQENKLGCKAFQHRISGEHQTYGWWNELNLRCNGEDGFTMPLERTNKPTSEQFEQAYLVMLPEEFKPEAPKRCKTVRDIMPGKEINKTDAEAYCNGQPNEGDSRGNKQLLIIQKSGKVGDRLTVIDRFGKPVAEFCYYGTFSELPNTHRWYMGNCSGEHPSELYEKLDGEWGFVELGGGACLRFNSIRRQGTYR